MQSNEYNMTENAGIARLWQGYHHLSEDNKDLVLALAETVQHMARNTQAVPEESGGFYSGQVFETVTVGDEQGV